MTHSRSYSYRIFFWTHRWFGIVAGLYFVLFGITGSYLVYENTFDKWMYPDRFVAESASKTIDLPLYVATAKAALQTERDPIRVMVPGSATENIRLVFNLAEPGEAPRNVSAYVDPSTLAFKGAYSRLESFGGLMGTFHHDLFLGASVGRFWMGISGLFLMALLLSGLWIWWPKMRFLKRSLTWPNFRGLYKALLDLHKLFGIYSLVLMIAVTFSGLYISVPGWFQFGAQQDAASSPRPSSATGEAPKIGFADLQARLLEQNLLERPLFVSYNARAKAVNVRIGQNESVFVFDPDLKALKPKPEEPKTFEMRGLQRDIHAGHYWGPVGEMLTFLSGLLPLFFWITGLYVWWTKTRLKAS
jgi:uncharacterized iron-regulated membrane protein